jgi:hypothetical protein
LVLGIRIENERGESSVTVLRIVKDLSDRSLQSIIASVSVCAQIVRKPLRVSSAADLVIGLIEISEAGGKIAFPVAFETGPRHDIEDAVRAVSISGLVAASFHLQIIDVLGVNHRAQIGGDIRVGYGDAVNKPVNLVASPHMQHVMGYVGSRHVISDHLQGVGAVGARSLLNILAAYKSGGSN